MPIYEFKCGKCKSEFECIVFRSDETVACPDCNHEGVERLMSACSFKSSGSYTPSAGAAGASSCAGCTSNNCSSCH